MLIYDKFNNIITVGDILKFDNDKCYLVIEFANDLVIQNICKYTPPLKLKFFIKKGNKISAERLCNINSYI